MSPLAAPRRAGAAGARAGSALPCLVLVVIANVPRADASAACTDWPGCTHLPLDCCPTSDNVTLDCCAIGSLTTTTRSAATALAAGSDDAQDSRGPDILSTVVVGGAAIAAVVALLAAGACYHAAFRQRRPGVTYG
mmetsp:Transcript_81525/g.231011  ORF Transcript_81525/g.231011 Transcript_81525/m.231011 type:complete len:136 (-) Transcript_81525:71-478(-)